MNCHFVELQLWSGKSTRFDLKLLIEINFIFNACTYKFLHFQKHFFWLFFYHKKNLGTYLCNHQQKTRVILEYKFQRGNDVYLIVWHYHRQQCLIGTTTFVLEISGLYT